MRLGVGLLVVLCCLLSVTSARADSVFFDADAAYSMPDPGVWRTPVDSVTATGNADHVSVSAGDPFNGGYGFAFAPPTGGTLATGGVYDHALETRDATHPSLNVRGPDSHRCDGGRFEVLDIAFGADDAITRLDVLFQCHADRPAGFGEIRIGEAGDTVPSVVRWPTTDAGVGEKTVPVTYTSPKALTVTGVSLIGANPSAFSVGANACSGARLAAGASCKVEVAYPATAAGTRIAAVRFALSDGSHADTALQGFAYGGTTQVTLDSDPGEPVANGTDFTFGAADLGFDPGATDTTFGATLHQGGVNGGLSFYAPAGGALGPATFPATRYSDDDPGAHLGVSATGSCTGPLTGSSYTVDETRHWPSGDLRSFAAHFVQHCGGQSAAIRGTLKFRDGDATPLPPWVDERPGDPAPAVNSASFVSDPDDLVGQHNVQSWTSPATKISVDRRGNGVFVRAAGGQAGGGLDVLVRPPAGQALAPGVYTHALGGDKGDATHGELQAGFGEFFGGTDGRFEVFDYAENPDGSVKRLWLVYEDKPQSVHGSYFGEVRFGEPGLSITPARIRFPETDLGRPSRYAPLLFVAPRALHVDSAALVGSGAGQFDIGPDECSGQDLAAGERCRVWVRFDAGAAGVAGAALRIASGSSRWESALDGFAWGGTTRVTLDGDAGAFIGGGRSYSYTPATARIEAGSSTAGLGFSVKSANDDWDAVAGPAVGSTLAAPSSFTNVDWWFSSSHGPRLAVYGNGTTCDFIGHSSFTVGDVRRWPDGTTRSAKLGFVQHCDDETPALRGMFEFRVGDQTPLAPWMVAGAASPSPSPTASPSPGASPTASATPGPPAAPVVTEPSTAPVVSAPPFVAPAASDAPVLPSPAGPAKLTGCAAVKGATARRWCRLARRRRVALRHCSTLRRGRRRACRRRARRIGRGDSALFGGTTGPRPARNTRNAQRAVVSSLFRRGVEQSGSSPGS